MEFERNEERKYASFTFSQGEEVIGTLIVELYCDILPNTCDNFISLLDGTHSAGHYKGTCIHRIVKGSFIQGGDIVDGTGKGDPQFTISDEAYAVKHDQPGILAMASVDNKPNTASSQFYITLNALPWMDKGDKKRVAFGKVIPESLPALRVIEGIKLTTNERPIPELVMTECKII